MNKTATERIVTRVALNAHRTRALMTAVQAPVLSTATGQCETNTDARIFLKLANKIHNKASNEVSRCGASEGCNEALMSGFMDNQACNGFVF